MKKLTIHNETNVELLIVTDESGYFVDGKDKVTIETNSKRVYIKNKNAPNAKIMLGLEYSKSTKGPPGWGLRSIYRNVFDSYFDVNDVCKDVFITAHCYGLDTGIAIFTVYKVLSANKEVQQFAFRSPKEKNLYRLYHIYHMVPLSLLLFVLGVISAYWLITDIDVYALVFTLFVAFLVYALCSFSKDSKRFYNIEKNSEYIMSDADDIQIDYISRWYIKYRFLYKKD